MRGHFQMGCCCAKTGEQTSLQAAAPKANKPPPADVIAKKVQQAKTTKVLALRECGLKTLPAGAEGLQLRSADLTANQLKSLPDSISAWSTAKTLQCSQNLLTELPACIGSFAALETLNLSSNSLKGLPPALSQCGKLTILQLESNNLGPSLSEEIFGGELAKVLKELVLAKNQLESLPASIGQLVALERLVVTENRLVVLPAELGGLSKLQHLDAAENSITGIPDQFLVGLTSLSELWLKGNPMDRLTLQQATGFDDFLARRKARLDARIEANVVGRVDLTVCGLD